MTDPYAELGVAKDATPADVRRAYRRRAKKAHPDHGGSAEGFCALQLAYETLSDPGRREHFDRTGEAKPTDPPRESSAFALVVHPVLVSVLAELTNRGASVESVDVVKLVRDRLKEYERKLKDEHEVLAKNLAAARAAAGRFLHADPEKNLLAGMARGHAAAVAADLARLVEHQGRVAAALDELKHYTYRHAPRGGTTTAAATTTTFRFVV